MEDLLEGFAEAVAQLSNTRSVQEGLTERDRDALKAAWKTGMADHKTIDAIQEYMEDHPDRTPEDGMAAYNYEQIVLYQKAFDAGPALEVETRYGCRMLYQGCQGKWGVIGFRTLLPMGRMETDVGQFLAQMDAAGLYRVGEPRLRSERPDGGSGDGSLTERDLAELGRRDGIHVILDT